MATQAQAQKALDTHSGSLMKVNGVVGLGIRRNPNDGDFVVAVYASPACDKSAIPAALEVVDPDGSTVHVATTVVDQSPISLE